MAGSNLIGVGGLVVDDPPAIFSFAPGVETGPEDAVHAHRAQSAGDDSGPAGLAGRAGVGRENPRADGIMGGVERKLKRLGGDPRGLGLVHADGAHLSGDARFKMRKSRAGSLPIEA